MPLKRLILIKVTKNYLIFLKYNFIYTLYINIFIIV